MATIDDYTSITSPDPRSGLLTAEQLQARRAIAAALATRSRPYPKTIGEGLTAFGEGLGEGIYNRDVARAEAAQIAHDAALMRPPSGAVPPAAPSVAPAVPRAPAGRTSLESGPTEQELATQAYAMVPPDTTSQVQPSSTVAQAPQQQSLLWKQIPEKPDMTVEEFNQRTARNESGGEKDPYRAIGKEISRRGDRAYGKYQVMGENIPVWTKQYFGQELTPQQFLDSKDAQEAVAKGRGGEYLAKYGPNGAAAAWFAGENGMKDASRPNLQTHIADYVMKFNRPDPSVERDQVAASAAGGQRPIQVASLGGGPTPDTAPDPTRDAAAQSLLAQQGVRPPQQQVAQAQPLPTAPPPPQQMPTLPPKVVGPQVPAYPAYGPKPTPPQPTPDMIQYYRASLDPYASAGARAGAKQTYDQMKADQDAKYARDYKFWEENYLKETAHKVTLPKQQEDLTAAHQQNLERLQKTITGETGAVMPDDPRLGTKDSPQRTGIPRLPPKPADMTAEKHQEVQAPLVAAAVEAVQRATPMFDDAIKTIQTARAHPGMETGLGIQGVIARQIPQTDAYAFGKINDQMVGKTFLTAYNTLKGGGQISNIEGEKAQTAQARIDPRQKPEDYKAALLDLEHQLRRDQELAQRKVNMPVTAWRQPGDNYSYAPDLNQPGTRGGKRVKYIGGDPAEDRSYQVLQ